MDLRKRTGAVLLLIVCAMALMASAAHAQAVISNGTVKLGINRPGELNFCDPVTDECVGIKSAVTGHEATYPGCLCEGWGAGIASMNLQGGANRDKGSSPDGIEGSLVINSFTSSATSATSDVTIGGVLRVVHEYTPSSSPFLYNVNVTLTNLTDGTLGTGSDDLRYRRLMDWDVEPTAFDEYVTLVGNGASNLLHTSNDGFESALPLSSIGGIECNGLTPTNVDFTNLGPCDHGGLFDFAFPALDARGVRTFTTFYGVAPTRAEMLAALGSVGAEAVYSFGNASDCGPASGTPAPCPETFAFAFKGVGGVTLPGPGEAVVPEPATLILLGSGLLGIAGVSRRRRKR